MERQPPPRRPRKAVGPLALLAITTLLRLIVDQTRQDGRRADGYGGTVDVRWNRPVTETFSYLLSLRYTSDNSEDLFSIESLTTSTDEVEPRIQFRWRPRNYDWSFGGRWNRSRTSTSGGPSFRRNENDLFSRFETDFENNLPQFLVDFNRREIKPEGAEARTNARLLAQVSYTKPWWSASLGGRLTEDDTGDSFERTVEEVIVDASVRRMASAGRISFWANYSLNDLNSEDRLPTESLVPIPRVVSQGLSALDTMPFEGPLLPEPALIDGNLSAATSINIGGGLSGGQTGWNIGAELVLGDPVDLIDLWLADPIPLENARTYSWEVYSSEDNLNWDLVTGFARSSYDEIDGRFRLTFPAVVARYVKVVNTTVDDRLGPVFVSEIEVFGQELRRGVTESGTRTQNVSANFTWAPTPSFVANLSGLNATVRNDTETSATRSDDTTGNLILNFQPSTVFVASLSALKSRRERTLSPTEKDTTYAMSLTALPFPDLELTTVATFRDRERGLEEAGNESVLFRAAALLYSELSLAAEIGKSNEENFDTPAVQRDIFRAAFDARPRREIQFNTVFFTERIVQLGQRFENTNWSIRFTIRPSSQISITAEGIYFDRPDTSGWSKLFQFDWLPFAGGTIQFSVDYRLDEPLGGQRRTQRSVSLRWTLNRDMFLDLDASRQRSEFPDGREEARTLYTAFFQARF
jgi:hypothetical protein